MANFKPKPSKFLFCVKFLSHLYPYRLRLHTNPGAEYLMLGPLFNIYISIFPPHLHLPRHLYVPHLRGRKWPMRSLLSLYSFLKNYLRMCSV